MATGHQRTGLKLQEAYRGGKLYQAISYPKNLARLDVNSCMFTFCFLFITSLTLQYNLIIISLQISKKDGSGQSVKYKRHKSKQLGGQKDIKCNNTNDQLSLDPLAS